MKYLKGTLIFLKSIGSQWEEVSSQKGIVDEKNKYDMYFMFTNEIKREYFTTNEPYVCNISPNR